METKTRAVIRCCRRYSTFFSRFRYTFLQIKNEDNEKDGKEIKEGEMTEKKKIMKGITRNYIKWAKEDKK